jgi:hypothetical protein
MNPWQTLRRLGAIFLAIGVMITTVGNAVLNWQQGPAGYVTRALGLVLALSGLIAILISSVMQRRPPPRLWASSRPSIPPMPPQPAPAGGSSITAARGVAIVLWVIAGLQFLQNVAALLGGLRGGIGMSFPWIFSLWGLMSPAWPACLGLAMWIMANLAQQMETTRAAIQQWHGQDPVVAQAARCSPAPAGAAVGPIQASPTLNDQDTPPG